MTEPRPPIVPELPPVEAAPRVHVFTDDRIDLVPNIGVVVGDRATLVVDTAMGPRNGARVLERVRELSTDDLTLTITHFHPEHGWGAQAFEGQAHIVYNQYQYDELREKFESFAHLFRSFGDHVAEQLEGVRMVHPDERYGGQRELDLGGVTVQLIEHPAHTRGDQVVWLPEQRVLFAGDLVENRFFPILPDEDAHGSLWIDVLGKLEALQPEVVVPGHGEVGGPELITAVREFLETVRERVAGAAPAAEYDLLRIQQKLEPELQQQWAHWDNPIWINFAIARFHAELE
ncbi:MAG TPA: MBL fold metallo-hydrolase [Gaiellaceae bacterium]